jgi:hypothetical protein
MLAIATPPEDGGGAISARMPRQVATIGSRSTTS